MKKKKRMKRRGRRKIRVRWREERREGWVFFIKRNLNGINKNRKKNCQKKLEGRRNKDGIWRRWRREGEQWGKKREEDGSQEKKRKKRNDFFNLSLRVFLVFHLFNIILKIKNKK